MEPNFSAYPETRPAATFVARAQSDLSSERERPLGGSPALWRGERGWEAVVRRRMTGEMPAK
jgi:hypothetical protein